MKKKAKLELNSLFGEGKEVQVVEINQGVETQANNSDLNDCAKVSSQDNKMKCFGRPIYKTVHSNPVVHRGLKPGDKRDKTEIEQRFHLKMVSDSNSTQLSESDCQFDLLIRSLSNSPKLTQKDRQHLKGFIVPTERILFETIWQTAELRCKFGELFENELNYFEISNPNFSWFFEETSTNFALYKYSCWCFSQQEPFLNSEVELFRLEDNSAFLKLVSSNSSLLQLFVQGTAHSEEPRTQQKRKDKDLDHEETIELKERLRRLNLSRESIGGLMSFCLDYAESATDCATLILAPFKIREEIVDFKPPVAVNLIARLFVISDILFNCSAGVKNGILYRALLEPELPLIFHILGVYCYISGGRITASTISSRVYKVLDSWRCKFLFPVVFIAGLRLTFDTATKAVLKNYSNEPSPLAEKAESVGIFSRLFTDLEIEEKLKLLDALAAKEVEENGQAVETSERRFKADEERKRKLLMSLAEEIKNIESEEAVEEKDEKEV